MPAHTETTYGDLVDRCGKLRMLSHRIALFVSLAEGAEPEELDRAASQLKSTLAAFDELYESVRARRISETGTQVDAPTVRHLLEEEAAETVASFRRRATRLYHHVQAHEAIPHATLLQFVDLVTGPLLDTLSGLTAAFSADLDSETKKRHRDMRQTLREIQSMSRGVHFISLNASIASARAGEAGTLFGAIAKEISALATESGASADRLAALLGGDGDEG